MATEIELKLQMDPRHLDRLRRHAAIQEFKQGRAVTRTLTSVYFDTAQHSLHAAGASLRVRHIGARRVQAVKLRSADGNGGSGHLSRDEWEQDIAGDQPDHRALQAAGIKGLITQASGGASLHPIFVTRFRRAAYRLGTESWEIELTLDKGDVTAGQTSVPICEAELELKRGRPADLYTVACRLARDIPLRVALGSKADRGYGLVTGKPPKPVKAKPVALRPDMTAAAAFQAIGRSCLQHLLYNEPALRHDRNPEAIHQMRVALRRLRSALSVFGGLVQGPDTVAVIAELKWITAELGTARDLDVFIDDILRPVVDAMPDDAGLQGLLETFEARRTIACDRALAAVDQPRYTQMVLAVAAWLEAGAWLSPPTTDGEGDGVAQNDRLTRPVSALAAEILSARHTAVLKTGRRFDHLDAPHRHRLRIQIKKLRYTTEFFSSLFRRKKTKAFAGRLTLLQDRLGQLNDATVAQTLLHAVAHEQDHATPHPSTRTLAFAAGQAAGWHRAHSAADGLLDDAAHDWKTFTRAKPFWTKPR